MGALRWIVGLGMALWLAGVLAVAAESAAKESPANAGKAPAEAATFEMTEISLFDTSGLEKEVRDSLVGGHFMMMTDTPSKEVKAYPKLNSPRPLYGVATFNVNHFERSEPIERYFVVDASEAKPESPDKASPLLESIMETLSGQPRQPSSPVLKYDRLYFDINGDKDLTNDPPVGFMRDPPEPLTRRDNRQTFDVLEVPFEYGPGLGQRPLKLVPQLLCEGQNHGYLGFVVAVARKGDIRIGQREFTAILRQTVVTGRFDRPLTSLRLLPKDGQKESRHYWPDELCAMREIDGQLYEFSATPLGDKLTVTPYKGPMGTLEVARGDRSNENCGLCGVLYAKHRLVLLGKIDAQGELEKLQRFELPAGDYEPVYLSLDLGQVRFSLGPNAYLEGDATYHTDRPVNRCIHIREGQPCVLEFCGKPRVLFTSPANDQIVGPGETVQIQALLIESTRNLLLSGLLNKTKEAGWSHGFDKNGKTVKVPHYTSLVPQVVIRDSSGKQVAQGEMPFG